MKFGLLSGCLWGLDTVIMSIALAGAAFTDTAEALALAGIVSAAFHDTFCAIWMAIYMALKHRLKDTWKALKTRSGKIIVLSALLGGPVGMTGYILAIQNVGPGMTAIISSFYRRHLGWQLGWKLLTRSEPVLRRYYYLLPLPIPR